MLQNEINMICKKVHFSGLLLKLQISNLSGESKNLEESVDRLYALISSLFNTKKGNMKDIYSELEKLNRYAKTAHKKSLENFM